MKHRHLFRALALFAGLLALASLALVKPAYANGNPAKVTLSYTQGISNFGPQNATGIAEIVTKEGEARLTATGLQVLRGEQYHFWIISSATNERFHLGSFTVDPSGVGKLDVVKKEGIPDKSWDLALISVEAEGSSPAEPSNRKSIAGRFPVPGQGGASPKPGVLPNTGGNAAPDGSWSTSRIIGMLVLGLALAGLAGFGLGRLSERGSTR